MCVVVSVSVTKACGGMGVSGQLHATATLPPKKAPDLLIE